MSVLGWIIAANIVVSLGSLVGVVTLSVKKEKLNQWLLGLVSLSAGGMMGAAFLNLLPEAIKSLGAEAALGWVLGAFSGFFILEKLLHWHHCHNQNCNDYMLGYMNLAGDSIHNLIDGLVIAATFVASVPLGIATTMAVALHEIPQEIGDFGVLVYSGWSRKKALIANLAVALVSVIGGVMGYFLATKLNLVAMLMSVAAGGFIYISAADLMPEMKKATGFKQSIGLLLVFLSGVGLMWWLKD